MIAIGTLGAVLALLTAGPTKDMPRKSSDVVQVGLEQGSIADGLESYYVKLTVAKGWHVYGNPVGKKVAAAPATSGTVLAQARPRAARVRPEVLDQVEKELKRLANQAQCEPKLLVTPAHEITYFLLAGLAEQGAEVKAFTASERREMRLGKSFEGKVMELAEGRRVVLGEGWMCFGRDGAAYHFAEYYVRRHGKWVRISEGKFLGE